MKIITKQKKTISIQDLKLKEIFVMDKRQDLNLERALVDGDVFMSINDQQKNSQTIVTLTGDYAVVKRKGPVLVNKLKAKLNFMISNKEGTLLEFDTGTCFRVIEPNGLSEAIYMIVKDPVNTTKFTMVLNFNNGNLQQFSPDVFGRVIDCELEI